MRRHSDIFPLVLFGGLMSLAGLGKSIYEDAAKAWMLNRISQWGYGTEAATLMSGFIELVPAFAVAAAIIAFLYWYIRKEFEAAYLVFDRKLRRPVGDFGFYHAYLVVMNTSPTEKLLNCRCEIVELRDCEGELVDTHIGLRTKNQADKAIQGRFNLDQGAQKEIPLFDINQPSEDETLVVINADGRELKLPYGIYTAKIRAYGDRGIADELTVRLNTSNCEFIICPDAAKWSPAGSLGAAPSARGESLANKPSPR
ncbi:hypothetical protein [Bradyrhizobium diazoefficiens]|uniref:hypothetical protein n=1 Tax=Bradyrhizobium diazoefficiens TaxID=1355477 RepID=UPI002729AB55|nr:hypothetical protein [Bradyrhizobium diazoefficiens]WLA65663.1 hypothetical protein QNN01_01845 [Bradyrhizobium diazoefficiens]